MNTGRNVRELRRSRKMTRQDLAEVIGVSFQSVSKWECGDGYPDIELLPQIARYVNVTLDRLMDMDEERYRRELQETLDRWIRMQQRPEYTRQQGADFLREQIKRQPAEWTW